MRHRREFHPDEGQRLKLECFEQPGLRRPLPPVPPGPPDVRPRPLQASPPQGRSSRHHRTRLGTASSEDSVLPTASSGRLTLLPRPAHNAGWWPRPLERFERTPDQVLSARDRIEVARGTGEELGSMTCNLVGTMIMLGFLALAWGWLEMRSVILRKVGAQAAAKRGTEGKRRAIRWSRDSPAAVRRSLPSPDHQANPRHRTLPQGLGSPATVSLCHL